MSKTSRSRGTNFNGINLDQVVPKCVGGKEFGQKTTITYDQGTVPFRLRLRNEGDLSNEILPNQNISGSQVPVNQPFPLQVSHAIGHLFYFM